MITVNQLSHHFILGKKKQETTLSVLQDISFQVNKGEIVTIVGKSGSGKSTLLNLISGFIRPTEGGIWINDQQVSDLTEAEFADFRLEHMGFIFQSFQLIPSMTAFQNIELPLILKGESESSRKKITLAILEKVGLTEFADHYPSELSGGQQQRVSIARALVLNPPLILADEPTGSLDSETETELLQFIKQLNQEMEITFLIITHDDEVAAIGDRTITISDGRIVEGARSQ
ncbi:ABC transporter ATP-binding protein [Oceanobacillus profundus]|uniref:ABC transporter ATP-binding protein n=1 Tax=Oceanobacillus profundus TaxID=372463 RepID=A0A417YEI9_9BACI|nr:ABC transporter ATP-binding protein [Oceanobacillus profundus]MBR3118167.1 ABC transporter ATP-binding protein [Oceanobacillus sp.]MCM3398950.1 ABC transporter ATP-binding protein [Oceanobacillus profundus]PAE28457.1 ABC transporter ATP-binding protein [Paenibacillus sp. 7884-2]RHW31076.1 ABC transporter ATP-binding protein [Oceanobacillus profundus]